MLECYVVCSCRFEGQFGCAAYRRPQIPERVPPKFKLGPIHHPAQLLAKPYLSGLPDKFGTMRFVDGSEYVGQLSDGVITGVGRYTDKNGDIMEGEFVKGALHGEGTRRVVVAMTTITIMVWQHGV